MLRPLSARRWGYPQAAHLLSRAGFGGTPAEVQRLVELGPERAVASLVDYDQVPDGTPDPEWAATDPAARVEQARAYRQASPDERRRLQQQERRTQQQRLLELRGWWLQRMAKGPRPLQEKLTLFWHGHFATSAVKVRDTTLMWRQNDTFRRHAAGNWLDLLTRVSQDPAMLLWLDQAQSRKEHPNENFARELMELFALGEGHYTEKDVAEAARALTGWTLNRATQEFEVRPFQHDAGEKTLLGRTGNLAGDDVLKQILAQPQAARFLAGKLWAFFASGDAPRGVVDALAEGMRAGGYDLKPVLRRLFLSEEFYTDGVLRTQVKSPTQWLVESARLLERDLPPPAVSAAVLRLLGQDLLAPQTVKGWDGGPAWINTTNLLNRYRVAAFLARGVGTGVPGLGGRQAGAGARRFGRQREGLAAPVDAAKLLPPETRKDAQSLIAALGQRFLQGHMRDQVASSLHDFLRVQADLDDAAVLNAVCLVLCTPDYQLC